MGVHWLQSVAADYVLVALSWLIVGAVLVPLRVIFPGVHTFTYALGAPLSLLGIAILHAALITLVAHTEGLGNQVELNLVQTKTLAKAVFLATALMAVAYGFQSRRWGLCALFCLSGLLAFGFLWTWRWWREDRSRETRTSADFRNVLIVGSGSVAQRVSSYVQQHPSTLRRVCGLLDDDRPMGGGVIGRVSDLARIARKEFVDEVILASPKSSEVTRWVVNEARRLRLDVEIVPNLFGCTPTEHPIEHVAGVPVICLHAEHLPIAGLVLKRVLDFIGSGLALMILSPLLVAIAVLIKLDSDGPVFYCAQRAGRKGRLFRCYKFRTMVSNADALKQQLRQNNERSGPFFKLATDPRITRLGQVLRRYSFDELPQLWNVIKGEMSLVGPRPHPLDDVAEYEIEHLGRLDVTPGITGLWQVTARRDPSFLRGMELDREYIRRWSLGLDARILLKTVRAVVCGSGE
jgi:exopolysaccharide biosynthesis polyprenyl glycosylphosphotransferase